MIRLLCISCNSYFTCLYYDDTINISICNKCINDRVVYAKTECKKKFKLTENDFKHLKFIKRNNKKLYLEDDILNILNKSREDRLLETCVSNKLEYKNYGKMLQFVKKNNITLDEIVEDEFNQSYIKYDRLKEFIDIISKYGYNYNEKMISCQNYINGDSEINLNLVEIESLLINDTKYLDYIYNDNMYYLDAQDKALSEYVNQNSRINSYIEKRLTINF